MEEKIPCEVIQDLLPLYADRLTHDKTNEIIKKHLETCEDCKNKYKNMTNKIGIECNPKDNALPEIDYLKKVKSKNQKKVVSSALIPVLVIIVSAIIKLFVIGFPITEYSTQITVAENSAQIIGNITNSSYVYSHYKTKDGKIIIYGCLSSAWNKEDAFTINYNLTEGNININGDTITSDGKIITAMADNLYKSRNPYIGDMSSNGELSRILDINNNLGSYLTSLQTSNEPYGWTLEFSDQILNSNETKFNSTMESYACVLLAMIDNCGEISWTYTCDGKLCTKTFTANDASQKVGKDIKSFSSSAENVQELLNLVNIKQ